MLAYAAQGREREEDDPLGVREALSRADVALDVLEKATPRDMGFPESAVEKAISDMLAVLRQDVVKARAAFRFVLAQRSIGSQMIDNVNASIHVRALLTDIFLLDEAMAGDRALSVAAPGGAPDDLRQAITGRGPRSSRNGEPLTPLCATIRR